MELSSLLLQVDTVRVSSHNSQGSIGSSLWFWSSIIEFIIIIILVARLRKLKSNLAFSGLNKNTLSSSKSSNIDMDNLMNSINNSSELYKELSRKCHPDRFINSPKQNLANEIFQEITKNKRDFGKLAILKQRAINELEVKF